MADCKIPEIPFASGVDQNLQRILAPIKETLDIWAGRAGDSLCRHVTIEDLLDETVTVNITSTGGSGNDPDAIHDDVASEILAVSLKATPAATDLLLIEDSADFYSKKRTTFSAFAGSDELLKVSANDTTAGYLEDKFIVSHGTNTTNPLELSTLNDAADEDRQLQFDESKVNHANLLNLTTGDPHTQYQQESEKSAANGYASLGATTLVPTAELGTGSATTATFLRGDQSWQTVAAGSDEQIKVSSNDTTAGYLEDKLVVSHGTNTTNPLELSTLNDGLDEDRQLQFDESKVDHDQLLNFLAAEHIDWALTGTEDIHVDRITAGAVIQHVGSIDHNSLLNTHNLTTDIDHDQLTNFTSGEHTDAQVKVSVNDSTPGYLEDKIVVASGTNTTNILELSTLNDGLNEDVQVQIDEAKINHANLLNLTVGDPHTQYQLESEKSAANGYASLGATTLVPTAELATGTANSTTFLRGDGTWSVPVGSGDVSKVGTPVNDQVGVWTGDGTIEGTSGLTYSGTVLNITGNLTLSGTVDGIDIATDVAANTLKVTNATHTGEVTGSGALSLDPTAISNKTIVTALGSDYVLIGDTSDTGNLKRALVSDFAGSHTITSHSDVVDATGAQLEELTGGGDTTLHDHAGITENTAARHAESHTVASHSDTTATGTELNTLTDNSIADTLHRHSELVESDGSPDPALSIATGIISTYSSTLDIGSLANGTGNRYAHIDLIGDDTYIDYGLRIIRNNNGANADSLLTHRGTGSFYIITQEAGDIVFKPADTARMIIASGGDVSLTNGTGINEFSTDGTLVGDSDDAVPTEKAVKTYIDTQPNENILINQDFSIWQENTTFTNPATGTYVADGYYIYSQAGGGTLPTVNVKKNTSAMETGFTQCCELEITNVGTAGTTRTYMIAQKIEEFEKYRGKTITVSCRIKASTTINLTNVRLLVYDGVAANSTVITSVTTSWVTYSTTLTVAAAATRLELRVFELHSTGTISTIGSVYIQWAKIELGSTATGLIPVSDGEELRKCQRYYQKSYNQGTFPGAVTLVGSKQVAVSGISNAIHNVRLAVDFPVVMKGTPTITLYDMAGTSGKVKMASGDGITGTAYGIGESGFICDGSDYSGVTASLQFHYRAVSRVA